MSWCSLLRRHILSVLSQELHRCSYSPFWNPTGGAGAVEGAGGGADVHVEGDADVGVAGQAGDVGGVDVPGEQGVGAEHVAQAVPGPWPAPGGVAPAGGVVGGGQDAAGEVGGPPV